MEQVLVPSPRLLHLEVPIAHAHPPPSFPSASVVLFSLCPGGIEVIILGDNFSQGLEVTFGESPAVSTQLWGGNTLVCILPPSPSPGPVVVGFKGVPMTLGNSTSLQLFTYLDTSDKALMELALQVVGMKMTGRIDDARNVARRIIGHGGASNGNSGSPGQQQQQPQQPQQQQMNNASSAVPSFGRAGMSKSSAALHEQLMSMGDVGQSREFQAIVIKLLSLLDIDYSEMDDQIDLQSNPINHKNDQEHSLVGRR